MKQEYSKQKINTSVTKRVFSVIFCLVVLASAITIPAFADNQVEAAVIPYIPNFTYTYANLQDNGALIATGNVSIYAVSKISSTIKAYIINSSVQGRFDIAFVDENQNSNAVISNQVGNTSYSQNINITTGLDSVYYGVYALNGAIANYTFYTKHVNTVQDAINDYKNGSSSDSGNELNISLPAGNVAYIQFNNSFDSFTLQCTMPTTSYAIGSSPWPESNQYYGFANGLPSGGFTPPTTKIEWTRNGRTSLAGVTNNAIFEYGPHHPTSGNYLVIYNPAYYGGTNNGPYEFMNNGAINIQASNVLSIKVYQLDSQLTQINPGGNLDIDTSLTGVDYDGEFDEETGDIVWVNGEQPVDGGGNLPTSSESGFQSFLSNLVQKIVNVFAPAQQAIQTLANAVSNFGTWMYSLYIWLPAPVLNLLTSAITLAIIIGVIKVFL